MEEKNSTDHICTDNRPIAFFKVDKTLLDGSTIVYLIRHFWDEGLIGFSSFFRLMYYSVLTRFGRLQESKIIGWGLTKFSGLSIDQFTAYIDGAYEKYIFRRFYRQSIDLIAAHREKGHLTVLVGAVPEYILERIRCQLGADAIISAVTHIKNGIISTIDQQPLLDVKGKLESMRAFAAELGVDLKDCYFYSNWVGEASLVEEVGHPILVTSSGRRRHRMIPSLEECRLEGYAKFTEPARAKHFIGL